MSAVHFSRIDPSRNMCRFYWLDVLRSTFAIRWDVGNQSVFEGNFLNFAGHVPQIYQQAIHLCHPHQGILLGQARKRPLRIERLGPNRLFNGARLGMDGALADFESATQFRGRHVRRKGRVIKKIDPAEHIDDTARPRSRLSSGEWARPFPAQRCGHARVRSRYSEFSCLSQTSSVKPTIFSYTGIIIVGTEFERAGPVIEATLIGRNVDHRSWSDRASLSSAVWRGSPS
jgi:hypothetical protein